MTKKRPPQTELQILQTKHGRVIHGRDVWKQKCLIEKKKLKELKKELDSLKQDLEIAKDLLEVSKKTLAALCKRTIGPEPEQLEMKARCIHSEYKTFPDPAKVHRETDKLMEETLIGMGYIRAINLIRAHTRWYE